MTPAVSVVIPTHNRRDSLLRLLRALAGGTLPPASFEVIICADGCTDGTMDAVAPGDWPFALRLVAQAPARGAATARNAAAALARAPLLLFLDDDIEPLPGLLATHQALHAAATGPLVVVGAPIPVRLPGDGLHQVAIWSWWEQQFERMAAPGYRFTYQDVFSGILSLPAAEFRAAGEFDTDLPRACRDDWELGLRLLRRGLPVSFTRLGGGLHHDLRDPSRLRERKLAEGRADVELLRRHHELAPGLRLAEPAPPRWSAAGLLRGLAFRAPALGQGMLGLLLPWLGLLERRGLRGAWHQLHGAGTTLAYWSGVAAQLGGGPAAAAELGRLLSRRSGAAEAGAWLDLDLEAGLEEAERQLEARRPGGLRVTWRGVPVGEVAATPGAEALGGRHLRPLLAERLAWEMAYQLATDRLGSA